MSMKSSHFAQYFSTRNCHQLGEMASRLSHDSIPSSIDRCGILPSQVGQIQATGTHHQTYSCLSRHRSLQRGHECLQQHAHPLPESVSRLCLQHPPHKRPQGGRPTDQGDAGRGIQLGIASVSCRRFCQPPDLPPANPASGERDPSSYWLHTNQLSCRLQISTSVRLFPYSFLIS